MYTANNASEGRYSEMTIQLSPTIDETAPQIRSAMNQSVARQIAKVIAMVLPPFLPGLWFGDHGETEIDQARGQDKAYRTRCSRFQQEARWQVCLDWSARRGLARQH